MNKNIKYLAIIIIALVLAGTGYYFWSKRQDKIDYITEPVKRGDLSVTVNATGDVNAAQIVTVGAQASGQIKQLFIKVGDEVKKGDMIAQIDPTTQLNTLQTQKAALASLNAQKANQQIQLAIAAKQYQRERQLLAADASSAAAVENAKDHWSAAQAALKQTEASIKQTTVAINTAEVQVGYTKIVAPFTGTVVSVPVQEGQTVNANQTTPTIAQIADLSRMEIKLQIAEGDITKVKPGMPVSYSILSEPNQAFHTTVQSIDPGLTALSDGTYNQTTSKDSAVYYYGILVVANEEGRLRIGMTTQNVITSQVAKNVLIVPTLAIKSSQQGKMVEVLQDDGKVRKQAIKTGLSDGLSTEVRSGLNEGDKVVMSSMNASQISQAVQQGQGRRPGGGLGGAR